MHPSLIDFWVLPHVAVYIRHYDKKFEKIRNYSLKIR